MVTGSGGQLGRELLRLSSQHKEHEILGLARHELDITDMAAVRRQFDECKPHSVIHCAAYTAVDLAETHPEVAFAINAAGTRNVAVAAQDIGASVCYVSTDYVFDGRKFQPYDEYDETGPQCLYGKSKLAGEILTRELLSRWYVVRTSWLYSAYGKNFVKTMLERGLAKAPLQVVDDQIGSPTYATDLAQFLITLVSSRKQFTCKYFSG